MTLEEVLAVMEEAHRRGEDVVRLHTGDPCLYGAIQEQMDALDGRGIPLGRDPGGCPPSAGRLPPRGRSTPCPA